MGIERVAATVAALLIVASAPAFAGGSEGIVRYAGDGATTLHTTAKLDVS
jgi:hypothetical protein